MNVVGGCLRCGEVVINKVVKDGYLYECPECGGDTWMTINTLVDMLNEYKRSEDSDDYEEDEFEAL